MNNRTKKENRCLIQQNDMYHGYLICIAEKRCILEQVGITDIYSKQSSASVRASLTSNQNANKSDKVRREVKVERYQANETGIVCWLLVDGPIFRSKV